ESAGTFRWMAGKAVDVFAAPKAWLRLEIGDGPPDAERHPIDVKVWRGREVVLEIERRDRIPLIRYIRVAADGRRTLVQLEVSRTWRISDFGGADTREQGVSVAKWQFLDTPPPGAQTIE